MPSEFNMRDGLVRLNKAFKEKKLGFQTSKMHGQFDYRDGSYCAVGAMMTQEQNDECRSEGIGSSGSYSFFGVNTIPDQCYGVIAPDLRSLEVAHDGVLPVAQMRGVAEAERQFAAVLEPLNKKYGVNETEESN